MKTTKLTVALAGLMIASSVIVSTSCKKKDTTTPTTAQDTNGSTASDNTQAEQHSNDAESIGSEAVDNGSISTYKLEGNNTGSLLSPMSGSVTVTGFGTGTVTVTFSSGYVGMDGKARNGTLIYTMSPATAHYRDNGMTMAVATTTTNPYSVETNTITIAKTVTNNGFVAAGSNMQWTITSNVTIAKASGGTFTWNANRTHVLLNTNANSTYNGAPVTTAYNGTSTPITWSAAIIQINGTANGTSADGVSYNVTTTNVVRNMNCAPDPNRLHFHPFVAGTVDFMPAGKTPRIINYGTGNCDMTYTISIGSWSETVSW